MGGGGGGGVGGGLGVRVGDGSLVAVVGGLLGVRRYGQTDREAERA